MTQHAHQAMSLSYPTIVRTHAPLADSDVEWLREFVRDRGEAAVVREVGLSRNTIARGCAGLGLYPGSHAMIRSARERHSPR